MKGALVFSSEVLGLELHGSRASLRWVDPATGEPLPVPDEYPELLARERQQAEQERRRADATEAELARLREELARLRKGRGE
ncbi:MAG: hypothetical protein HY721_02025 [Planctomycetes bacterium]|nr:hypothetical protein [Planctomycetota bacterium]